MTSITPDQNKALVLEAFDMLFNKRDYEAASRFWSDKHIQHSAHIEPGREGLFRLIRTDTLRYEHGLILAEGDYVIVHRRFSGIGRPAAWVAADVVAGREASIRDQQAQIAAARDAIDAQVAAKVDEERGRIAAAEAQKATRRVNRRSRQPADLCTAGAQRAQEGLWRRTKASRGGREVAVMTKREPLTFCNCSS